MTVWKIILLSHSIDAISMTSLFSMSKQSIVSICSFLRENSNRFWSCDERDDENDANFFFSVKMFNKLDCWVFKLKREITEDEDSKKNMFVTQLINIIMKRFDKFVQNQRREFRKNTCISLRSPCVWLLKKFKKSFDRATCHCDVTKTLTCESDSSETICRCR